MPTYQASWNGVVLAESEHTIRVEGSPNITHSQSARPPIRTPPGITRNPCKRQKTSEDTSRFGTE
ncbi:hypothetical protein JOE65_000568 [Arthrobacter roseus]|nr:hypothetical protein [Arthrobacter roseus]